MLDLLEFPKSVGTGLSPFSGRPAARPGIQGGTGSTARAGSSKVTGDDKRTFRPVSQFSHAAGTADKGTSQMIRTTREPTELSSPEVPFVLFPSSPIRHTHETDNAGTDQTLKSASPLSQPHAWHPIPYGACARQKQHVRKRMRIVATGSVQSCATMLGVLAVVGVRGGGIVVHTCVCAQSRTHTSTRTYACAWVINGSSRAEHAYRTPLPGTRAHHVHRTHMPNTRSEQPRLAHSNRKGG